MGCTESTEAAPPKQSPAPQPQMQQQQMMMQQQPMMMQQQPMMMQQQPMMMQQQPMMMQQQQPMMMPQQQPMMMQQQQPVMMQPQMQMNVAYIPIMGYQMPSQPCIPPAGYNIPKPDQFVSNAVWQGNYEQDGQQHQMTWTQFQARPGEVVRGKGRDDIGEFVLQGWVEQNGMAHFEKQYLGKHLVMYDGMIQGKEISGTWAFEELRGPFRMSRANRTWKGQYHNDGTEHQMTIDNLNIFNGQVKGQGRDDVGEFTINGDWNPNGQVAFVKQYIGQHNVHYEGSFDGLHVQGQWKIPSAGLCDAFMLEKAYPYDQWD